MLDAAIREFRETVGTDHVFTDAQGLDRYTWSTIPVTREIAAVVQPASVDEVQRLVQIARDHHLPLYPISTGQNWGYGSALPARDRNVIVDLRRMNRIHEVNRDLAYAVVEPGVTQQQLYDHLQAARIPLALIDQHVDAVRAIIRENKKPQAEAIAAKLTRELRGVSDDFLREENKDRLDELDGILSPPLVPDDAAH